VQRATKSAMTSITHTSIYTIIDPPTGRKLSEKENMSAIFHCAGLHKNTFEDSRKFSNCRFSEPTTAQGPIEK
jgi:hypothetical protein